MVPCSSSLRLELYLNLRQMLLSIFSLKTMWCSEILEPSNALCTLSGCEEDPQLSFPKWIQPIEPLCSHPCQGAQKATHFNLAGGSTTTAKCILSSNKQMVIMHI